MLSIQQRATQIQSLSVLMELRVLSKEDKHSKNKCAAKHVIIAVESRLRRGSADHYERG